MKQYTNDYTLIQEAMDALYSATRLHANECYHDALQRINAARTLLSQYLSQDNMTEDNDVYDGWCKASEVKDEIAKLKDQIAHYQETMQAMGKVSMEVARRSEETIRENDALKAKVVKHGKIDRQYNHQLEGAGDPDCPLHGKDVRITGTFDQIQMTRDDVAAACQRLGAKSAREGICKSMDIVIIGNNPGPTKQPKIEQWRSEGYKITTLSQFDFKEIQNKYDK